MFRLDNVETGETVYFTIRQLLDELNRDRSDDWSDYTMQSTLKEVVEAVEDFTDYTFNHTA